MKKNSLIICLQKYTIALLLCIIFPCTSSAQEDTYYKIFNYREIDFPRAIFPDGNGNMWHYDVGWSDPALMRLYDEEQNLIKTVELPLRLTPFIANAGIKIGDRAFVFGITDDAVGLYRYTLVSLDMEGEILVSKLIELPEERVIRFTLRFMREFNGMLLLSGLIDFEEGIDGIFCIGLDPVTLEIQHYHVEKFQNYVEVGGFMSFPNDSTVALHFGFGHPSELGFILLDEQLNLREIWKYEDRLRKRAGSLQIQLPDGNFLIHARQESQPNWLVGLDNSFMVVDQDQNIVHRRFDGIVDNFHWPGTCKQLRDGDFLFIGGMASILEERMNYINPYLIRFSPEGELRWFRTILTFIEDSRTVAGFFDDFYEDESGYIHLTGNCHTENVLLHDFLMAKVDQHGCFDTDRCNMIQVVDQPSDTLLYHYDDMVNFMKEWRYTRKNKDGSVEHIHYTMGPDSLYWHQEHLRKGENRYFTLRINDESGTYIGDERYKIGVWPDGRVNFVEGWISQGQLFAKIRENLYDFRLEPGDNFKLPFEHGTATVVSTDSIALIDGVLRKRIVLRHDNEANQRKYGYLTWIEGIGSPNGLLYFYDWERESQTELVCYHDRHRLRYLSDKYEDCSYRKPEDDYLPIISAKHQWIGYGDFPWWWGSIWESAPPIVMEFVEEPELVQGTLYHRLRYKNPTSTINNDWVEADYLFREESGKLYAIEDKVFFNEILIMDMSANIGDTITLNRIDEFQGVDDYMVVVTDEEIIISNDGKERKKLSVELVNWIHNTIWIEGIGAIYYQFDVEGTIQNTHIGSPFVTCFLVDGERIWSTVADTAECYTIVSVEDHPTFGHIRLYPNPTTDVLTIDMDGYQDIFSYDILSLTGAHIRKGMAYPGEQILVQDLAPGMYILRLQARGGAEVVLKWVRE
jgi:hypothetical protein